MVDASPARSRYTIGRCRRCGAFELHRCQPRTAWQRSMKRLTPLVPMRCPACGTRTLRLAAAAHPRPAPPPALGQIPQPSRHARRQRRRLRRRLNAAAWVLGAAATAGVLGYLARRG